MSTTYIKVDCAMRDTLLAALRLWQDAIRHDPKAINPQIWEIARENGKSATFEQIDEFCESINEGICPIDAADECPNCGDVGTVTGEHVEIYEDMATQVCYCGACDAEWVLGFGLTSVIEIRP